MPASAPDLLDVRPVSMRRKRLTIAAIVGSLKPGESFVLVDDGDLESMRDQFDAEQPGTLEWEYLERGPAVWRVRITRR